MDYSLPRLVPGLGVGASRHPTTTPRLIDIDNYGNLFGGAGVRGAPMTSPIHHHRLVQELEDQVNWYKKELERKDQILTANISIGHKDTSLLVGDFPMPNEAIQHQLSQARASAEGIRADLAAEQVKNEALSKDLCESKGKVQAQEVQVRTLKDELESYKENNARQGSLAQTLRGRVDELEDKSTSLESLQNRERASISIYEKENKEQKDRIHDLESRLHDKVSVLEDNESKAMFDKKKFDDLAFSISHALGLELGSMPLSDTKDVLSSKIHEMKVHIRSVESKLNTVSHELNSNAMETKASRETIMRLVSEVNKEQRVSTSNITSLESIKHEKDRAMQDKSVLERENKMLKDRLETSQKSWSSTRLELEQQQRQHTSWADSMKTNEYSSRAFKDQLDQFRDQLACILGEEYKHTDRNMDAISMTVRELCRSNKNQQHHVEMLEDKLKGLTNQLNREYRDRMDYGDRAKYLETQLHEHRMWSSGMEGDMAASDVLRDDLRKDKQSFLSFIEKMSRVMKIDKIASDVGYDMTADTLISRAEQLVKQEAEALVDKNTRVYDLQRRVKKMKEDINSKDLHMDMLRKKVVSLEEKIAGRSSLEVERDDAEGKIRKMQKQIERFKSQLGDSRLNITELKAELSETKDFKIRSHEQRDIIGELQSKIDDLSVIKEKQAKKLAGLKQELDFTKHESTDDKSRTSTTTNALTDELRTTKRALDEVARREKQLIDFRAVLARMLGLDITALAVPDYEIIARLEQLVQSHHKDIAVNHGLEDRLKSFWDGYEGHKKSGDYKHSGRHSPPTFMKTNPY